MTARKPLDDEPLKQLAVVTPPFDHGDLHEICTEDRTEHELDSVVGRELCVEIGGAQSTVQRLELNKQQLNIIRRAHRARSVRRASDGENLAGGDPNAVR